jgi:hypothetical protein
VGSGAEAEASEATAFTRLLLLNPLVATHDEALARISALFARTDNLSHVLCWSDSVNANIGDEVAISYVELPRLQLRFCCRDQRLYSLDHDGFYLAQTIDESVALLVEHIPHALVFENGSGQRQLLVPSYELQRVSIRSCPLK